jgi:hypothetical protein
VLFDRPCPIYEEILYYGLLYANDSLMSIFFCLSFW